MQCGLIGDLPGKESDTLARQFAFHGDFHVIEPAGPTRSEPSLYLDLIHRGLIQSKPLLVLVQFSGLFFD